MTVQPNVTAGELLERINALGTEGSRGQQAERRQEIVNQLKELKHAAEDRERLARDLNLIVAQSRKTEARIASLQGAGDGAGGSRPALTALNAARALQEAVRGRRDLSDEMRRELTDAVSVLWVFAAEEEVAQHTTA